MISLSAALLYILLSLWPCIEYASLLSEAIEQTRLHTAVLAVVTGVVLLVAKRRIAALLLLLGAAGNLLWIYTAYSPTHASALATTARSDRFRILSFNAHINNRDIRSLVDSIELSNADFVLIIEANAQLKRALVEALKTRYPYHTDSRGSHRHSELIAFSKHGMIDTDNYLRIGPRAQQILFVPLVFNGDQLNIYGLHTLSPISSDKPTEERIAIRHQQVNQLIHHIASENGNTPFIIAGDMNSAPWHTSMRGLRTILKAGNADSPPALNLTWPTWLPLPFAIPIDHIYHSQTLCRLQTHMIEIPGSDHRAVYADLTICPGN